jgi:hypothetical protein
MNDYDATGGEQGWIMKSKLNELRLDAGIARIENQQWLCVLDKETGMMNTNSIEPIHTAHAINQRIKKQFGVEE